MSKNKKKPRIDTSGTRDEGPTHNPFAALRGLLPEADDDHVDSSTPEEQVPGDQIPQNRPPADAPPPGDRGRIDILRNTAGRGGKTVTVATGFEGLDKSELKELLRDLQRTCGVGGTAKDGRIEIQGDQRDEVEALLEQRGFRPVRAGG